ncbi:MAG: LPS-assembly protein LptD [Pedosphaera sp.]|nr:LPS-assembly protein LptD [Pedosphaera sp.]
MQMELSGSEAQPLAGSKVLLKQMKIRTFPETGGDAQMIAEAPECIYDLKKQQADSAGPLQVHTGDGRFRIEGNGFVWQQSDSSLVISNQVHSVIKAQAGTNASTKAAETKISSDRAWFEMKAEGKGRSAVYQGSVRVEDAQMNLISEILTAELPQEGGSPNHIVAETNVVIDFFDERGEKTHATCDKAVYSRNITLTTTNEVVELTGQPRLERTNGWMTADVFYLDRTANTIRGVGHYRSRLQTQPQAADLSKTNAPTRPETEITSDAFQYEMHTGSALYQGSVRVDNPRFKLSCENLAGQVSQGAGATNHLNNFMAETNVVADFIDERGLKREITHATGDTGIYTFDASGTTTNETIELRGNPRLERTNGWMSADIIIMNRTEGVIRGIGNHHSFMNGQPAGPGQTNTPANSDTEIFSNLSRLDIKSGLAVYEDNVRLKNPQLSLVGGSLTVRLPQNGGPINYALAETGVVADFVRPRGLTTETIHATGEKLVYNLEVTDTTTNGILELTGKPRLEGPLWWGTAEEAIIYNQTTGRMKTRGDGVYRLKPAAFTKTKPAAPEKNATK